MQIKIYRKSIIFHIAIPLLIIFHSCTPHEKYYSIIINSDLKTEGFLDNNVFQVKAFGKPENNISSVFQRRNTAIRRAYANAIERAIDLIIKERLRELQRKTPDFVVKIENDAIGDVRKNFRKEIINGQIIQKEFSSNGSCSIIYRIQKENLKKLLSAITLPIKIK